MPKDIMNSDIMETQRSTQSAAQRSTKRPEHLDAPSYLRKNTPVPAPQKMDEGQVERLKTGPTRFGDWEKNGIAIDF